MVLNKTVWFFFIFMAAALFVAPLLADETAESGRRIVAKNEQAVLKVQLVIRFKLLVNGSEMRNNETKIEATGLRLHSSGLTLISLNMTDPGRLAAQRLRANQSGGKMNLESELTDVKMILPDGTELPARVVLRDRDLDLAFVQPTTKPATALPAINVHRIGTPDLFDEIFVLNRLGKTAGRAASITVDRIQAIMHKPRLLFIPHLSRDLGAAVFTADEKWIGTVLLRTVQSRDINAGAMVVVLPADDILDIARQIPGMEMLAK
jgi:hypothetical protein